MIFKLEEKSIKIESSLPTDQLTQQISKAMYDSTMNVFDQEGPGWTPLKQRTIKQRLSQGFGEGPILNRKRGRLGLKGGIIEASSGTKAIVGVRSGIPYARIHQLGGTINFAARSETFKRTKHTKDTKKYKKGQFKKLPKDFGFRELGKGLSFKAFSITIPARQYLIFTQQLKDEILSIAKNYFKS